MKGQFGFHLAFAVAVGGMAISVFILWKFKNHIEAADIPSSQRPEDQGRHCRRRG